MKCLLILLILADSDFSLIFQDVNDELRATLTIVGLNDTAIEDNEIVILQPVFTNSSFLALGNNGNLTATIQDLACKSLHKLCIIILVRITLHMYIHTNMHTYTHTYTFFVSIMNNYY